jgi:hypothetical protein
MWFAHWGYKHGAPATKLPNEPATIRLDGSLKEQGHRQASDMVAWSTMVWELAVGDTMVATFIWLPCRHHG